MRIDNSLIVGLKVRQSQEPKGETGSVRRSGEGSSGLDEASTYTSAPELVQLLELVHQTPDVRQELLRRVAERVANGDYLTSQAAQETAEAMIRAAD